MPELIVGEEVYEHSRRHYVGSKPRPVCSGCSEPTMVVKVDHGPEFGGIPPRQPKPDRYEHIGYWCPRCRVFFPWPEES